MTNTVHASFLHLHLLHPEGFLRRRVKHERHKPGPVAILIATG